MFPSFGTEFAYKTYAMVSWEEIYEKNPRERLKREKFPLEIIKELEDIILKGYERVHDSQKAKELVEGVKKRVEDKGKKVSKVIADAGYDTHEFFRYLGEEGIEPAVLVRKGAKIRGNPVRDSVIRQIRKGKKKWKEAVGYGKRWLVESFFSVFKRWFGEYVVSKRFENMRKELVFKVGIINTLMVAGMV